MSLKTSFTIMVKSTYKVSMFNKRKFEAIKNVTRNCSKK